LDVLLNAIYLLAAVVVAVLALPMTVRLAAVREEPGKPPDLGGAASVALGLIGVAARGRGSLWEVRVRLLGVTLPRPVISLGPGAARGGHSAATAVDEPDAAGGPTAPETDPDEPAPSGRGPRAAVRRGLEVLDMVGPPALALLRSLPRVLHLRRGRVSGRFGFADPGQTGRVFGALQALRVHTWQRLQVRLQPDWTDTGVRVRGEALFHFHLGLLLYFVIRCAARVGWRWLAGRVTSWAWVPGAAR